MAQEQATSCICSLPHQPKALYRCAIQWRHHTALLVVSGFVAIDEVYDAVILLTNRWPGLSPTHKDVWESVGCESLTRLVLDLPQMFTTVCPAICVRCKSTSSCSRSAITSHWLPVLTSRFICWGRQCSITAALCSRRAILQLLACEASWDSRRLRCYSMRFNHV